ncbi:lysophospholipase [bacterium]|nr:lysophospholipase [bacterium]
MIKWILRLLAIGVIIASLLYVAACHIAPYSIIKPHRLSRSEIEQMFSQRYPDQFGLTFDTLSIPVNDTITLKGWFLHSITDSNKGTVFVLHGIASCKEAMLPLASKFCRNNYNVVLFDLRTHGESGGEYCTYGYWEKRDVVIVIDSIQSKYPQAAPFAMFGNSLGAAITIQTLAIEPRLTCAVVESPFATLREVTSDYLTRIIKIRWRSFSNAALNEAGSIAKFPVDEVQPEIAAFSIRQPVLVVHGTKDKHISIEYGKRVYHNLQSPYKEFYEISEGDHYNLMTAGGIEYENKIMSFFDHYCKP